MRYFMDNSVQFVSSLNTFLVMHHFDVSLAKDRYTFGTYNKIPNNDLNWILNTLYFIFEIKLYLSTFFRELLLYIL